VAAPSPEIVAEWLTEEADNQTFKPLREVVEKVLSHKLQKNSPEDNAELSERLIPAIVQELETRAAEDRAEGIDSSFQLSSEGEYFRLLAAPELPVLAKLRVKDPEHFEKFCAQILSGLGAKSSTVGGWKDGGVDFIAVNLQLSERVKYAPRSSQTVVIGQAKRYNEKNNITELMLRQFIGGAILRAAQIREESKTDAGLLTPVIYAYWTTSDFHHEARKYAKAMGMWYLNGVGVTQLALRAGVNVD
jgi:hypothetical protein